MKSLLIVLITVVIIFIGVLSFNLNKLYNKLNGKSDNIEAIRKDLDDIKAYCLK